MKRPRPLRHLAEYFAFRLVVCLVAALPTRLSVQLANALAFVVHRLLPGKLTRYTIARENLRIAFGDDCPEAKIDRTVHAMWRHLFRMVIEIVQLPRKMRLYNLSQFMSFRHRDESTRALSCGRPTIVLSGHFGNWEVANATFGHFGFPLGVVARDLDNPWLHRWFERFRRHTGHRLISKRGGGDEIVQAIQRRGAVAMLGDQDAGPRGLFVPFFGRDASTFKSIALLALEYRAVVVVGYVRRLPDDFENCRWVRFEMGCEEVLDPLALQGRDPVRELTERYTQALERMVRLAPEQYFWIHRRWKSQPQARRRARAA